MKKISYFLFIISFYFASNSLYSQQWAFSELPEKEEKLLAETRQFVEQGEYEKGQKTFDSLSSDANSVYSKKLKVFEKQSKKNPSEAKKGIKLYRTGKHEEAQQLLSEALERNPNCISALEYRILNLCVLNPAEALKECDRILHYLPLETEILYERGIAHRELGKRSEAVKDFSASLFFKQDGIVYYQRGFTSYELKNYADAVKDFSKTVLLNQKDCLPAYFLRANAYCNLEEFDKSETDCMQYIKNGGKQPLVYKTLSIISVNRDDYAKALEYAEKVINLMPNSPEGYCTRAFVYYYMNEYQKSIADGIEAIKLNPKFSTAYIYLCRSYLKLGNKKKAVEFAKQGQEYASLSEKEELDVLIQQAQDL